MFNKEDFYVVISRHDPAFSLAVAKFKCKKSVHMGEKFNLCCRQVHKKLIY